MLASDLGRQLDGLKAYILPQDDSKAAPQVASSTGLLYVVLVQVCVFSATIPEELDQALEEWIGSDAVSLTFSMDAHLVSPTITQVVHVCADHKKLIKLKKHLTKIKAQHPDKRQQPRILIFANTIKKVRSIYNALQEEGFKLAMLHGKRTPAERHEAMEGFRSTKT